MCYLFLYSLVATIREFRPELCMDTKFIDSLSIPKIPPKDYFKGKKNIFITISN